MSRCIQKWQLDSWLSGVATFVAIGGRRKAPRVHLLGYRKPKKAEKEFERVLPLRRAGGRKASSIGVYY